MDPRLERTEPGRPLPTERPLIELAGVSRHYDMGGVLVQALDDIDLRIQPGEYVAVMGPSGSGKSTLMNILGCLDTPTSGSYRLAGEQVSDMTDDRLAQLRNREIGFIFQVFNLLARSNAVQNVELPLIYAGVPRARRRRLAEELLVRVGLADRQNHRPNELSGGQRQRVAVARALANRPSLILADEPTGNLDSRTGDEIMDLLDELHREGRTVILVTHEESLGQRAQRLIRLLDGRILSDERLGGAEPHRSDTLISGPSLPDSPPTAGSGAPGLP